MLCNTRLAAKCHEVLHDHMPGKLTCIGDNDGATNFAVMCNVGIGHDETIVSDTSLALVEWSSTMNGNRLAQRNPIPDLDCGRLSSITGVLRLPAYDRKRKNLNFVADSRMAPDDHMLLNVTVLTYDNVLTNQGKRPNPGAFTQNGFWMNDSGGVDMGLRCHLIPPFRISLPAF